MLAFPKTISLSTVTFLDLGNHGENNYNTVSSCTSIFYSATSIHNMKIHFYPSYVIHIVVSGLCNSETHLEKDF